MKRTRYAVKNTHAPALYVHKLAPYTQPSATPELSKAKLWTSPEAARQAIRRYNLTNVAVVPVKEQ